MVNWLRLRRKRAALLREAALLDAEVERLMRGDAAAMAEGFRLRIWATAMRAWAAALR